MLPYNANVNFLEDVATIACPSFTGRMTETEYLQRVAPCTGRSLSDLDFFYACAPQRIHELFTTYLPWQHDYMPPPAGALWPPVWTPACCFMRSHVPPELFWTAWSRQQLPRGQEEQLEGFHIRDDNDTYAVEGLWIYVARGAGVRYSLGPKTLKVPCKLLAFGAMGLAHEDTAALIYRAAMRAQPNVVRDVSITATAQQFFPEATTPVQALVRLLEVLTRLYEHGDASGFGWHDLYAMDRLNNSADYDRYLTPMAKAAGITSLQFCVQANGMAGWAHEVVLLQSRVLYKPKDATWAGWQDLASSMQDTCGRACHVDVNRWMATCQSMDLPLACLGKPNALPSGGYSSSD